MLIASTRVQVLSIAAQRKLAQQPAGNEQVDHYGRPEQVGFSHLAEHRCIV